MEPRRQVEVGGSFLAAIVADTHSRPHPRIAEHLAALRPQVILHAGDIGDLGVVDRLGEIAETIAVRGNIDVHAPEVPDAVVVELTERGEPRLSLYLTHIAVNGPKLRADVRRRAEANRVEVVVCGHSHVPFLTQDRGLVVFNPGSIGPRRFQLPITFGVMRLEEGQIRFEHRSSETGERWRP